jgi:hypothetical protein
VERSPLQKDLLPMGKIVSVVFDLARLIRGRWLLWSIGSRSQGGQGGGGGLAILSRDGGRMLCDG